MSRLAGLTGSMAGGALSILVVSMDNPISNLFGLLLLGALLGAAPGFLLAMTPGHEYPLWALIVQSTLTTAFLFIFTVLGNNSLAAVNSDATAFAVRLAAIASCGAASGSGYALARTLAGNSTTCGARAADYLPNGNAFTGLTNLRKGVNR